MGLADCRSSQPIHPGIAASLHRVTFVGVTAQRFRILLRPQFHEAFMKVDMRICLTLSFTATKIGTMEVVIENGVEEDMLCAIMQFTGMPKL
jgi:aspartyl-tRNA(Asn)/glutamyl-tRNA(Gln) amidotransferase subunit A